MFKVGEIIVCIDNKEVNYVVNDDSIDDNGMKKGLTINKKYKVKFIKNIGNYSLIYFINDHNVIGSYYSHRFITLLEYRKQKLDKLCSKLVMK